MRSASLKRSAALVPAEPRREPPDGSCGSPASSDNRAAEGGPASAAGKRRRTADPAAALTANQEFAALEATVGSQGRRIAGLEADNARLSIEVAWLRKRPRLPEPAAALQQLVTALGARERDLRDTLFELVCRPRFLAKSAGDLPPDPAGVLGTFAVSVPLGTLRIAGDAFRDCAGLAQVTLPATVAGIDSDEVDDSYQGAFSGCTSLSEITLPPNLTKIGHFAFSGCASLIKITLPVGLVYDVGVDPFQGCPGAPRSP